MRCISSTFAHSSEHGYGKRAQLPDRGLHAATDKQHEPVSGTKHVMSEARMNRQAVCNETLSIKQGTDE